MRPPSPLRAASAAVTDPLLSVSYYNRVFGWPGLYVSQVLPYSSGSYALYFQPTFSPDLMLHVNALIITIQQIYPYNAIYNALQQQYSTTAATGGSTGSEVGPASRSAAWRWSCGQTWRR